MLSNLLFSPLPASPPSDEISRQSGGLLTTADAFPCRINHLPPHSATSTISVHTITVMSVIKYSNSSRTSGRSTVGSRTTPSSPAFSIQDVGNSHRHCGCLTRDPTSIAQSPPIAQRAQPSSSGARRDTQNSRIPLPPHASSTFSEDGLSFSVPPCRNAGPLPRLSSCPSCRSHSASQRHIPTH